MAALSKLATYQEYETFKNYLCKSINTFKMDKSYSAKKAYGKATGNHSFFMTKPSNIQRYPIFHKISKV